MALYFNLPVYKESYNFLLLIFQFCSKLPREYKYTLGERLKNESTNVLIKIFEASNTSASLKQKKPARRIYGLSIVMSTR